MYNTMGNALTFNKSKSHLISYYFSCEVTVSREDGSEFDSTKTMNLYRSTVKKICDSQLKTGNILHMTYFIYLSNVQKVKYEY